MSGNPHKGEVSFEANGAAWTLRYSTNAICSLEADLDMGVDAIVSQLQASPRMSMVRAVFRAGLLGKVSEEAAGDLVDAVGFARAAELIGEAFARAFPQPEPEAADAGRPPKGDEAGTGRNS